MRKHLELKGYGTHAVLEGNHLIVTATSTAGRHALGTQERTIPMESVLGIEFKSAGLLTNGSITIQTDGGTTKIHFLKKAQSDADELITVLRERAPRDVSTSAKGRFQGDTVERVEAYQAETARKYADGGDGRYVGLKFDQSVDARLAAAIAAAGSGDIESEERELSTLLRYASMYSGQTNKPAVAAQIAALESRELLRIGSKLLGTVRAESGMAQLRRKQKVSELKFGDVKEVIVRTDRIVVGAEVPRLDRYSSAQVFLDGSKQITQRPTLIRALLLSPLPGSALLPALALQKKETNDARHAEFQIGGLEWSVSVAIDPDKISHPRQIAELVNRSAAALEDEIEKKDQRTRVSASPPTVETLHKLQALVDSGLLTATEALEIKNSL